MKKIRHTDIIGQQGINLIEKVTLEMGFLWHPTGLEAGIDGYIEIRDAVSGAVTNCIVQVQSKATEQPFEAETPSTFVYRCTAKDLDYWLHGNAPVILVRSRPKTQEAYWVPLKEYFKDLATRKTGTIVFDKQRDRFAASAKAALQRLAIPADAGLYLGTTPKPEIIYSDLLPLTKFPAHYYVAKTEYRRRSEVLAALRAVVPNARWDWILKHKAILSFHDLSQPPWSRVCDPGTVEEYETEEWATTDDLARQRDFVELLNMCLREQLHPRGIGFNHDAQYYFFRASHDLSARKYSYQSREKKTTRTVFRGYPLKKDPTRMAYYRHAAFIGRFLRFAAAWFLQMTPTYHFTKDGWIRSPRAPQALSGIKKLENNQAVHGQVVMWASFLTAQNLFDTELPFLTFEQLLQFQGDVGLEDAAWLKHEDSERRAYLAGDDPEQMSLL
jgi:hypothetical protein